MYVLALPLLLLNLMVAAWERWKSFSFLLSPVRLASAGELSALIKLANHIIVIIIVIIIIQREIEN